MKNNQSGKKISLVIFFILIVFCFQVPIRGDEVDRIDMEQAFNETKDFWNKWDKYVQGQTNDTSWSVNDFDMDVWCEYHVLVLKNPGTFPENLKDIVTADGSANDKKKGEYRYLGKTPGGYLVNNPNFPDDSPATTLINNYNWQKNIDISTSLDVDTMSEEDREFYSVEIFRFLKEENQEKFNEQDDERKWLENAIVVVPASSVGRGVIRYMHLWDSRGDGKLEKWYITVNLRSKNEFKDRVEIEDKNQSQQAVVSDVMIGADQRGAELFNVTEGMPTSEDLYIQARADEYMYHSNYKKITGSMTYTVTIEKEYLLWKWDRDKNSRDKNGDGDKNDPGERKGGWCSKLVKLAKTYPVKRQYSYYTIDELDIWDMANATFYNEALPNGEVTITSKTPPPTVYLNINEKQSDHILLPYDTKLITYKTSERYESKKSKHIKSYPEIPIESFRDIAEKQIGEIKVRNDMLVFNGITLMDNGWYEAKTPLPVDIPKAKLSGLDDLYKSGLTIGSNVLNGLKVSKGKVTYTPVVSTSAQGEISLDMSGVNSVFVHTPVVCYPEIGLISRKSQECKQDIVKKQFSVEESFVLKFPDAGQHRTIKGYGDKDYGKYVKEKQVKFPFDVYIGADYSGVYLPKNTWWKFPLEEEMFFIPSWVSEGNGYILFRSIAENITKAVSEEYQYGANKDPKAYKAVEAIAYNISGKIFNFTVTDCKDDFWKYQFDNGYLYAGSRALNYLENKKSTTFYAKDISDRLLPLMPGKNYKNPKGVEEEQKAVRLGYPINFNVTTNGDWYFQDDLIVVKPTYFYVEDKAGRPDMGTREAVDIYVSEYNKLVPFSGFFCLTGEDRNFIGNIREKASNISKEDKQKSVQFWQGDFYLPNMSYAVLRGTSLSLSSLNLEEAPFLHDGYIIVHFDISVYANVAGIKKSLLNDEKALEEFINKQEPSVRYSVGWSEETYETTQLNQKLQEGDVLFYYTDKRASDTYY